MSTQTPRIHGRTFRAKLQGELRQRDMGIRTLARAMHRQQLDRGVAPRKIESLRRQLSTYLRDHAPATPRPPFRHEVEDALSLERDSLCDDEEGDRAMRMTIPVVVEVPLEALEKHLNYDLIARAVEARREQQEPRS